MKQVTNIEGLDEFKFYSIQDNRYGSNSKINSKYIIHRKGYKGINDKLTKNTRFIGISSCGLTYGNSACILNDNICNSLGSVYKLCEDKGYLMFEFNILTEMFEWFTK